MEQRSERHSPAWLKIQQGIDLRVRDISDLGLHSPPRREGARDIK